MSDLKRLTQDELSRRDDEEVVAYIVAVRGGGRPDLAEEAMAVLAFGHWDRVLIRVRRKVAKDDAEDVTAAVIESALTSIFSGKSIGEFNAWLNIITRRRIADHHRHAERTPATSPYRGEHEDEEGMFGTEPYAESEEAATLIRHVAYELLDSYENQSHAMVICLYGPQELGWENLSATETVEQVEATHPGGGLTAANVHQIWKRFKEKLNGQLGLEGS